jgi:dimeric dUTPase (all-alpha-NTP-PPase superfamily)
MELTLDDIFKKQIELNQKINPSLYTDIQDPEVRKKWFLNFDLALKQESAEAIDSLNWKWWKKDTEDWDNVKIELVDMLHFWVSMCTIAGLTAQEVMDLYAKKNKLNHNRQDQGYKQGTYSKYDANGVEDNVREVLNK